MELIPHALEVQSLNQGPPAKSSPWRFLMKTNIKRHSTPSLMPSEAFVQVNYIMTRGKSEGSTVELSLLMTNDMLAGRHVSHSLTFQKAGFPPNHLLSSSLIPREERGLPSLTLSLSLSLGPHVGRAEMVHMCLKLRGMLASFWAAAHCGPNPRLYFSIHFVNEPS